MSAPGHKQTFALQNVMPALPPKADMRSARGDVPPTPAAAAKRFLFAAGAGLAISGARPFDR